MDVYSDNINPCDASWKPGGLSVLKLGGGIFEILPKIKKQVQKEIDLPFAKSWLGKAFPQDRSSLLKIIVSCF